MRQRKWAMDFLILFALAWAGYKFTWDLERWFDIPTFDEAEAVHRGDVLRFELQDLTRLKAEWSPLYVTWYALLKRLAHPEDRVALHDLNWRVLAVLTSMGLYVVLRRYHIRPAYAAALALFALLSRLIWFELTRSVLLAVGFALLAAWWATWYRKPWKRLWVAGWSLWLAAFTRPEYALAAGLVTAASLITLFRAWRRQGRLSLTRKDVGLAAPVLLAAVGFALWGRPFGHGRSVYAFGQHFAFNRWSCMGMPGNRSWEEEVEAAFGPLENVYQAVWRNPALFARHVGCNVARAKKLIGQITIHAPFTGVRYVYEAGVFAVAWVLGSVLVGFRRPHRIKRRLQVGWARGDLVYWGLLWAVLLSPILIISSDKPHYRAQFGWATLVLWAYLFLPRRYRPISWRRAALIAALVVAVAPPTMAGLSGHPRWAPTLYNRATIQAIRHLNLPEEGPITVSGHRRLAYYFLVAYLDERFQIGRRLPQEDVLSFIQTYQPDLIIVHRPWYGGDDSWEAFQAYPEAYGYWVYPIGEKRALYIRADRIPPPKTYEFPP